MNSPVFFGETEREGLAGGIADEDPSTRGLLESYPHDQIHRAVGGIIDSSTGEGSAGAMASPPTAGFDPIFSIHHSNIDRLWTEWACKPGKKWGKIPSDYWFDERPWYFYDTDGKVVNEPRRKYFDHRALGIRFRYED
ncbi:MAG TPA: tyrosinase family protein, partial [Candidatus Elarobacter sp.]|nr:tyrosinase family protein [Candidatus Elarobacter sp.]